MSDLPKGLYFKLPHANAPDFVRGKVAIKNDEFIEFLKQQPDEWTNLDLKISKNGKGYAQVDNWKPDKSKAPQPDSFEVDTNDNSDELPF